MYNSSTTGKYLLDISASHTVNGPTLSVTDMIAPGVSGCSKMGEANIIFVVYVLLVTVETAIVKYQRRREGSDVLSTLLQHSIFYYACGLSKHRLIFNAGHQKSYVRCSIFCCRHLCDYCLAC
nr:pheromone [Rhizopogon roseolus]